MTARALFWAALAVYEVAAISYLLWARHHRRTQYPPRRR